MMQRIVLKEIAVCSSHSPRRFLARSSAVGAVPVDATRQLGAQRVIAVDLTFPPEQADLADPGERAAERALPTLRALF